MNRVLIFGAGFSRAISETMPLTEGLGQQVLARLREGGVKTPSIAFTGQRFEAWLSRLAEPQPDLDAAVNLENRAMFLRVSNALREVLLECETQVLTNGPHWWLQRLVGTLHFSNTTVITFNYDTLLERTLEATWLADVNTRHVNVSDVLRHMPPVARHSAAGSIYATELADTFRYLKLHGSVDTFWVTGDESGSTIGRFNSGSIWGKPAADPTESRAQVLPGRDPFIVPPAAAKSKFYANPLARELWHAAAQALKSADEVTFVGYSIPSTDLVTSGMLVDTIGDSGATIKVVDPHPEPVVANLMALGFNEERISCVFGDSERTAVHAFTDGFEATLNQSLETIPAPGSAALALAGGQGLGRFVTAISEVEDETVTVEVGEAPLGVVSVPLEAERQQTLDMLRAACPDLRYLKVRYPGGKRAYVGRLDPYPDRIGGIFRRPNGAQCLLLRPTAEPWTPPQV